MLLTARTAVTLNTFTESHIQDPLPFKIVVLGDTFSSKLIYILRTFRPAFSCSSGLFTARCNSQRSAPTLSAVNAEHSTAALMSIFAGNYFFKC